MNILRYFSPLLLLLATFSYSQTVSQWRGDQRRGIYPDTGLLQIWPAKGPRILRTYQDIGNGYGSPTIAGEFLYITGEIQDTACLFAFGPEGDLLWKSDFGKEWVINYEGSRCAPTVVDDLVYVISGLGAIACFDAKTGTRKWLRSMPREMQGVSPLFGFAEAPIVYGNLVFATPGGKDTNVVALDRFTGEIKWVCAGNGEAPGYNSPILIRLPERTILALFSAYSFLGIDTRNGELLWSDEQVNIPIPEQKPGNGDTHSNSAWFEDGSIYYIAGDGNGAVKLALLDNGKKIRQVWRNKTIDNYMGGFVIRANLIYTCTTSGKSLVALDAGTGEITNTLKIGTGSLIWADEMIYYYTQEGKVYLVGQVGQVLLEVRGLFTIIEGSKEHFSHPVIHGGVLYVRHGNVMMAYDITGETK
ncbi:MAG: PQQ-binding-like beta-propeller repeat protein [Bacteroidales bacterium]|nr:PQQ-binding-like beta-propeller repeat protein [Bacteroidales bacterium]